MEISKSFVRGVMNKDLDDRLVPDGVYRDALNIKASSSDAQDSGTVQNYFGNTSVLDVNTLLTNAGFTGQGNNLFPIGSFVDTKKNRIYWFITSPTYDIVARYTESDAGAGSGDLVLVETRGGLAKMNFNRQYLITGVNLVENLLFFTDGLNQPRRIDVDFVYRDATITDDNINVIMRPPLSSPTIALRSDSSVPENAIEDKFIRFSYRYKYVNNEVSAMSPFSKTAFEAQVFKFNFNTGRNESMRNKANSVDISVDLGPKEVVKVDILMKDSRSNNAMLVTTIDKSTLDPSQTTYTYNFKNDKVYTVLPASQLTRLFDNVPLSARAQDLIGSRIVYGNYRQFFDLKRPSGELVVPDFTVSKKSIDTVEGVPVETIKSGRTYEVGIAYLDKFGRMTTVLESKNNTAIVPISDASKKNQLEVTINNRAPEFAVGYRFFLKQNRGSYYNILPLFFHRVGSFVYLQIAKYDIDKVKAGGYVYIKSSPSGLNTSTEKYKILEAEQKKENFLGTSVKEPQEEGFYLKISVESGNLFSADSYITTKETNQGATNYGGYDGFANNGRGTVDPLDRYEIHVDTPIFYGKGLSTLTCDTFNSAYNYTTDTRIHIEVTAVDKFRYRLFNSSSWIQENVAMSSAGVMLTFAGYNLAFVKFSTSPYSVGDTWRINYRSRNTSLFGSPIKATRSDKKDGAFAIVSRQGKILPGTVIYIQINDGGDQPEQRFVSSGTYENLEEWFFEEEIYSSFIQIMPNGRSDGSKTVFFRKSKSLSITRIGGQNINTLTGVGDQSGFVSMIVRSYQVSNTDAYGDTGRKFISLSVRTRSPKSITILETEGSLNNEAIYYECPKTYPVVNGAHKKLISTDLQQPDAAFARITVEEFNAISFGNGMESSVIEDDWNGPQLMPSPRASAAIDNYKQVIADNFLTYSGVFNESSSTNNLNEFNLSLANFKQLDKEFGPVQKLHSRAGDLLVLQEDKVSKVLFGKNLLVDSASGGVVASVPEVLGTQIPYVSEYGISNNPESFSSWGSSIFFTDSKRGAVISVNGDNLEVISNSGMKNWFRDLFDDYPSTQKLGAYDPYEFKYVLAETGIKNVVCDLSVSNDEIIVSGDAITNGFLFNIKSNSSWSISVANGSWLTLNATSGSGDRVITGILTSNLAGATNRTATLTITYCDGATKQVTITQSNEKKKEVIVVTVGDKTYDSGKLISPAYGYDVSVFDGIRNPIDVGTYSFVNISPDFVGEGAVPASGGNVNIIADTIYNTPDGLPAKPFNPLLGDKMYFLDTDTIYDPSQGDSLLLGATPVSPTLVSGKYVGTFSYSATGDYLYLIIDYRNNVNTSSTVTASPAPQNELPESIAINNGSNIGNYTITYSSTSTDIRFVVENSSGGIVADTGYVNAPTSQTLSIKKLTQGSDVLRVYNRDFTAGRTYSFSVGSVSLTSASISDSGYDSVSESCASSGAQTVYHSGSSALPVAGDIIYTSSTGLQTFNGQGLYYKSGTNTIQISSDGVVIFLTSCVCTESNPPVIQGASLLLTQGQVFEYKIQATNNAVSFQASGNCREFNLFGGTGGAVFAGQDCKTGLEKQIFVSSMETIQRCFFISSVYKVAGASDASFQDIGGCVSGALPDGVSFDPLLGIVSGTPSTTGSFQFTVTATNCAGVGAPVTFDLTVQPEIQDKSMFSMDISGGYSGSSAACSASAPSFSNMYHDGILSYPVIRDMIFYDEKGLNIFMGNSEWYKADNGVVFKIGNDGVVEDTFLCNIAPPTPPSLTATSLAPGADSALACLNMAFNTFYRTGSIGINPGKIYTDSLGTTLAPPAWYKYEVEPAVFVSFQWDGDQWIDGVDCPP